MKLLTALWEGAMISALVVLLLVMAYVHDVSELAKQGELLTGNPIIVRSPLTETNTTERDPPSFDIRAKYRDDFEHENIDCLLKGGVNEEDVFVAGGLLEGIDCTLEEEVGVDIQLNNDCLEVSVERDLVSVLCIGPNAPSFSVVIPEDGVAPELVSSRSYNGVILFVIFIGVLFLVWREFEIRDSKKHQENRQRVIDAEVLGEPYVPEEEQTKVVYMRAAPLFKDVATVEKKNLTDDEIKKVHDKFIQDELANKRFQYETLKKEEIAQRIVQFNKIARNVVELLQRQEIDAARRQYLLLFPLYTQLYHSVEHGARADLESVLSYLNVQIKVSEKGRMISELIAKTYKDSEKRRRETGEMQAYDAQRREEVRKAQEALKRAQTVEKPTDALDEISQIHEKATKGVYGAPSAGTARDLSRALTELRELLERGAQDKESLKKYSALFKRQGKVFKS